MKPSLPGWFPFAVTASFLIMVAAGSRAKWKLAADQKAPPGPQPPLQQGGLVHGWPGVRFG